MPFLGKRVLAFGLVSVLIGTFASAAPAVTDPGDLVIDPAQVAAKAAQAITQAAVQFGGAVIDSGVVTADTIARMKAHFRGKVKPEDLRIKDADSPNERAIKTFLNAINGRLVPCGGKLAMKVPINMTSPDGRQDLGTTVLPVLTDGIYVICVASPDPLPSGAESVKYRFIISLHKSYFAGSEIDPLWDDEMFRWKEFPYPRELIYTVRISRRAPRVEAVFPGPPQIKLEQSHETYEITCSDVPRVGSLRELQREIKEELKDSEVPMYLEALSKQGDVDAMFILALVTLDGKNVSPQQTKRAVDLLTTAAAGRSAESAFHLSSLYLKGAGVPKDLDKAIEYLEMAQKNGFIGEKAKGMADGLRKQKQSK